MVYFSSLLFNHELTALQGNILKVTGETAHFIFDLLRNFIDTIAIINSVTLVSVLAIVVAKGSL